MQTSNWRERFKEIMLIGIGEHHSQDCCAYWQGEKMVELEAFIEQVQKESIERAIEVVKDMPRICGICNKTGVNPYGECQCSYEDKDLIKGLKVIEALKTLLH